MVDIINNLKFDRRNEIVNGYRRNGLQSIMRRIDMIPWNNIQ